MDVTGDADQPKPHGERTVRQCYYYLDSTPTQLLHEGTLQVPTKQNILMDGLWKKIDPEVSLSLSLSWRIAEYSDDPPTSTYTMRADTRICLLEYALTN